MSSGSSGVDSQEVWCLSTIRLPSRYCMRYAPVHLRSKCTGRGGQQKQSWAQARAIGERRPALLLLGACPGPGATWWGSRPGHGRKPEPKATIDHGMDGGNAPTPGPLRGQASAFCPDERREPSLRGGELFSESMNVDACPRSGPRRGGQRPQEAPQRHA